MSDHVEIEGDIVDSSKGIFKVRLDTVDSEGNPTIIICTIAGKLRQNKIQLLVGDRVKIKVSPYDLTRGFVFQRLKLADKRKS